MTHNSGKLAFWNNFIFYQNKLQTHLAVDGISQSIHYSAQQLLAHRHIHDGAGSLHNVALLDQLVVTKHHHTNIVWLQVQSHTLRSKCTQSYNWHVLNTVCQGIKTCKVSQETYCSSKSQQQK